MLYYSVTKLSSSSAEDSNDNFGDHHDADDMMSINSCFQETNLSGKVFSHSLRTHCLLKKAPHDVYPTNTPIKLDQFDDGRFLYFIGNN